VVVAHLAPGWSHEQRVAVEVPFAQGGDVAACVCRLGVGQHDLVLRQVKEVVVSDQRAVAVNVDWAVRPPPAEDRVAHRHMHRHGVVVLHVHQVVVPHGVVHRHVDDFEARTRLFHPVNDDGRPGSWFVVAIAPAVDEGVLNTAAVSPDLDPIAGVVGDDAAADGCVGGFGVQPVAIVVFGTGVLDQDRSLRRLNAKAVGAVVGAVGAVAALVVVTAPREGAVTDGHIPPAAMLGCRAAQRAIAAVFYAAVEDLQALHILDVHPVFVNVMDVEVLQDDVGGGRTEDFHALAEVECLASSLVVMGDLQIVDANVLDAAEVDGGEQVVPSG